MDLAQKSTHRRKRAGIGRNRELRHGMLRIVQISNGHTFVKQVQSIVDFAVCCGRMGDKPKPKQRSNSSYYPDNQNLS